MATPEMNGRHPARRCARVSTLAGALLLGATAFAAGPNADQATRMYNRIAGVPPTAAVLTSMMSTDPVSAALLATNIVRSRPGRAMQAVRDQDVAAEVIGVSLTRYKIGAFAVSSALAAVAGGLFGVVQQFANPTDFGGAPGLVLSITYVAMIIIGGISTIRGSIIGAILVVGLPQVIQHVSESTHIPFVKGSTGGSGYLSVFALNQIIFGLLIIVFLLFESRGITALFERARGYFRSWPFSR